ncbi:UNVERIFIED_CONTAM: hypothetical protein RF653_01825 [Kocuria sp. CPCC 205316]|uniref:hypothetical protein n=1 Tax=Kocuria TaxID=57493 RepID=UPI0036DA06B6
MTDQRPVTGVRTDPLGNIVALCNPAEVWSPRSTTRIIRDIESGVHLYYVPGSSGQLRVRVVSAGCEKRLWAASEDTVCNNLHDLPSV